VKLKAKPRFSLLAMLLALAAGANAGPPGALDDPFAIGAGNVEFIVATYAAEQAGEIGLQGPVFDITMGVTEQLDFLFIGGAFHVVEGGAEQAEAGFVVSGFKWQALAGPEWNGAWTPVVVVEIDGQRRVALSNAVQIERSLGRFAAGLEVTYTWIDDEAEAWFENSSEPLGVTLGLGQADPGHRATDVAFNLGFDWEAAEFLHVLASAGTGIASDGRERIGWQGYFGLQWLWGAPPGSSDPPLMAARRRR